MISETSLRKTLLDIGSLQIPDDYKGEKLPFSACYYPEIQGVIQTDSQVGTITLSFNSEAVQNYFLGSSRFCVKDSI